MNEKDINILIALVQEKLEKGVTREEALYSFTSAGIMDDNADYTSPYKELETLES
jgi:hypothetical protein